MKKPLILLLLALPLVFSQCSVNQQISQAKALANCKYTIASADSVFLAGTDIRQLQFRSLDDLTRYPRLATGLLLRNVPLSARINLNVMNPTGKMAGINQFEYRILLAGQELFNGFLNQPIEIQPGGQIKVPIRLTTNAYQLISDNNTRDAFVQLVQNLSGAANTQPSRLTIKIKPTLALGNKEVNYPGYITIEQEINNKTILGN